MIKQQSTTGMFRAASIALHALLKEQQEEVSDDGKGSWRRRGVSIKERNLLKFNDRILFETKADYLKILPEGLNGVFTNRESAKLAKISVRTARQITYCLRKTGVIQLAGKNGRELVFQKI
jgi:Fic family protein